MHVSQYCVNTMTLTTRSDATDIDLDAVFRQNAPKITEACSRLEPPPGQRSAGERPGEPPADAAGPAVVLMVHRPRGEPVRTVGGVTKRNGRRKRYSPNVFENQATMVVRMGAGTHTNVKLFRNGCIQMTGSRSEEAGREAAETVLRAVGTNCVTPAGGGVPGLVSPMNVCLMNSHFHILRGHVDRQAFYETASGVCGVQSSFQPAIYPAVKCFYMWRPETPDGAHACLPYPKSGGAPGGDRGTAPDKRRTAPGCSGVCPRAASGEGGCDGLGCCKRVTVLVFHTGAVIITGAVSHNQIRACHQWVSDVCRDHGAAFLLD